MDSSCPDQALLTRSGVVPFSGYVRLLRRCSGFPRGFGLLLRGFDVLRRLGELRSVGGLRLHLRRRRLVRVGWCRSIRRGIESDLYAGPSPRQSHQRQLGVYRIDESRVSANGAVQTNDANRRIGLAGWVGEMVEFRARVAQRQHRVLYRSLVDSIAQWHSQPRRRGIHAHNLDGNRADDPVRAGRQREGGKTGYVGAGVQYPNVGSIAVQIMGMNTASTGLAV